MAEKSLRLRNKFNIWECIMKNLLHPGTFPLSVIVICLLPLKYSGKNMTGDHQLGRHPVYFLVSKWHLKVSELGLTLLIILLGEESSVLLFAGALKEKHHATNFSVFTVKYYFAWPINDYVSWITNFYILAIILATNILELFHCVRQYSKFFTWVNLFKPYNSIIIFYTWENWHII